MTGDTINPQYHGYFYHYYRAEVYRETNWRNRLDVTTNWSIVVTAAMLSYVFGNTSSPHAVLVMNYMMVLLFLYIESRRFRYYTMLKNRTRMIEAKLLSPMFLSVSQQKPEALDLELAGLSKSLEKSVLTISKSESMGWRLRRVYIFLLAFLYITWINKLAISPLRTTDAMEIVSRASLWFMPGWVVFSAFTLSILGFLFMAIYLPLRAAGDDLP
jgi:uncharacterized membrane protein